MKEFRRISECRIGDNQDDNLYLTFDIDWACDDVLSDTIDLVERAGVSATWFVTHQTPLLERLHLNPRFELGIHPNFNFLLEGKADAGVTAAEVIDKILAVVPGAKASRSHSLTQNSRVQELLRERGLTHDCNYLISEAGEMVLSPWTIWNGLLAVPHFWEDAVRCISGRPRSMRELAAHPGIKVFDFHPIHVFLNTATMALYERTRQLHRDAEKLAPHRHQGEGTRTWLQSLLQNGVGS